MINALELLPMAPFAATGSLPSVTSGAAIALASAQLDLVDGGQVLVLTLMLACHTVGLLSVVSLATGWMSLALRKLVSVVRALAARLFVAPQAANLTFPLEKRIVPGYVPVTSSRLEVGSVRRRGPPVSSRR